MYKIIIYDRIAEDVYKTVTEYFDVYLDKILLAIHPDAKYIGNANGTLVCQYVLGQRYYDVYKLSDI